MNHYWKVNSNPTIPPSTVKKNPKFSVPETDAIDNEISNFSKKE